MILFVNMSPCEELFRQVSSPFSDTNGLQSPSPFQSILCKRIIIGEEATRYLHLALKNTFHSSHAATWWQLAKLPNLSMQVSILIYRPLFGHSQEDHFYES